MRTLAILAACLLSTACATGSFDDDYVSRTPAGPTVVQYGNDLEDRVYNLERSLYNLAVRICRVEGKLDGVTFEYLPNGGVIIRRSGQAPRQC